MGVGINGGSGKDKMDTEGSSQERKTGSLEGEGLMDGWGVGVSEGRKDHCFELAMI